MTCLHAFCPYTEVTEDITFLVLLGFRHSFYVSTIAMGSSHYHFCQKKLSNPSSSARVSHTHDVRSPVMEGRSRLTPEKERRRTHIRKKKSYKKRDRSSLLLLFHLDFKKHQSPLLLLPTFHVRLSYVRRETERLQASARQRSKRKRKGYGREEEKKRERKCM